MSVLAPDQIPSTVPQYKKVTLTANQIKALRATPVELVAAPGAGYVLIPVHCHARFNHVTTEYTVPGDGNMSVQVGDNALSFEIVDDILTTGAERFATVDTTGANMLDVINAIADVENQAITIRNLATDEFTLGDGTLDVILHFLQVPTP